MRIIPEEEWGQIGNQFRPLSPEEEQYYQLAERANQLNKGTLGDAFALNPAGMMDAEMVPPSLEEAQRNAMLSRKSTLQPFDLPDWMENILPGLQEAGANWAGGIDYALTGDSDRAELRAVGKQMRSLAQSGLEGYSPRIQSIAESVATSLPAGLAGGGVAGLATKLGASTALAGKASVAATTGLLSWIYGTNSYWDTYSRATQSGMDEEAADAAAMFNTMAEIGPMTVLSAIGMGGAEKAIAGQALSGPAARSLSGAIGHGLTGVGKTILEEELEELTTTLLQQFGDSFSGLDPEAMKPENLIPALYETAVQDRKSTRLNSSHNVEAGPSRMPSSA
jgi:hypothetical protein